MHRTLPKLYLTTILVTIESYFNMLPFKSFITPTVTKLNLPDLENKLT